MVPAVKLRVFRQNAIVASLEFATPNCTVALRNVVPRAPISGTTVIRASMGHTGFDRSPDVFQVVWKIARVEAGLHGHHPATDVDSDCGRNDCALRRDHAAYGCPDAPVNVRHRGNPLEYERELGGIGQLLTRLIFKLYALRPGFDGYALLRRNYVVGGFRHVLFLYSSSCGDNWLKRLSALPDYTNVLSYCHG